MTDSDALEAARALVERLRALNDEDLDRVESILYTCAGVALSQAGADLEGGYEAAVNDPVARTHLELHLLARNEKTRRRNVLWSLEADLQGGHRVWIWLGDQPDRFAAYCSPRFEDDWCWFGPDRETVEEALEDGRAHHPGYEPVVEVEWP